MLGTGTQLDPYQITTVAEFRGMNDSTAYFKLMNDLDINDSEWATGWTDGSISFSVFDGDGFEIRNINHITANGNAISIESTSGIIKNVNFRNFVSLGSGSCFYKQGGYNLYFRDCTFDFDVLTNYVFNVGALVIERCAFTLKGELKIRFDNIQYAGTFMTNSHIKLDSLKIPNGNLITIDSTRVSILGDATKNVSGTSRWFSNASQCFVAVDMIDSDYKPTVFSSNNPTTPCFYDKDLLGAIMTAQTNVHALTTAQCKNKDYLNSIGFVVV